MAAAINTRHRHYRQHSKYSGRKKPDASEQTTALSAGIVLPPTTILITLYTG